jgi:hypothetical protein
MMKAARYLAYFDDLAAGFRQSLSSCRLLSRIT